MKELSCECSKMVYLGEVMSCSATVLFIGFKFTCSSSQGVEKHVERGKVSSIRIRKTLPKPQNNLTPMGLPKPIRYVAHMHIVEFFFTFTTTMVCCRIIHMYSFNFNSICLFCSFPSPLKAGSPTTRSFYLLSLLFLFKTGQHKLLLKSVSLFHLVCGLIWLIKN